MKIGVICPSEIAIRRFMPALSQIEDIEFVGVGVNSIKERYGDNIPDNYTVSEMLNEEYKKAEVFLENYGGKRFDSYEDLILSSDLDSVYIPLPPALHYKWAKLALENGKHVLVEKPYTTSYEETNDLIGVALKNNLVLHENYMFVFHKQLKAIENYINSGEIGEVRLYRVSFGFPRRKANDFRYDKTLGGGALIDAGGYTIKYATMLLGHTAKIKYANLNYIDGYDVDMYGSASLINSDGLTVQIAFGMDNDYKCELEVWGSKGTIRTDRILTAPVDYVPTMTVKKNTEYEKIELPSDDAFKKSIIHFMKSSSDERIRIENYNNILRQAELVGEFKEMAKL